MTTIPFILRLIYNEIVETGNAPSMRSLSSALGCSQSTMHTIIHGLKDRGYVEQAGRVKTITLTEKALALIDTMK